MSLLVLLLALGAFAPTARAQVIETARGRVEFIGLKSWTPEMIYTKLGYDSLDKMHHCAALLKDKLGFADASVNNYVTTLADLGDGEKLYTVITVVEPGDAGQVQYKPKPTKSIATPAEWGSFSQAIARQNISKVGYELQFYAGTFKNAIQLDAASAPPPKQTPGWWGLLQQLRGKRDYETALKVLSGDQDPRKRRVAALILTNFAGRDKAWSALMEGVRDGDQGVVVICTSALFTLTRYVPRTVDWSPAAESLRHLLNGTDLFALPQVLRTLSKTSVSHRLAKPLLRNGGGRMLLPYLRAQHEDERTLSHGLLARLSGKDFGYDDARWAAWMASIN
jgi:hypothetical protein